MRDIETQLVFRASPRTLFKALANPNNIPNFVPGILNADVVEKGPNGKGTRVTLTTRHANNLQAEVVEEHPWRYLALRDERGVLNTWELREMPTGTLAINRIVGPFSPEEADQLGADARMKLHAFREIVDRPPAE
ncbi:MAG: SRPBCC family protein [Thermoplasmatota archaeon]